MRSYAKTPNSFIEVEDEDDTEEADVDTDGGIGGYNFG